MTQIAARLKSFHQLARELAAATERLEGVPEEMRALHDEYTAAQAELAELAAGAEQAVQDRRSREGAVADAQETLRKFQQQVPKVRNQREYGALLTEIDGAKSALRGLEESALEAIERADRLAKEIEERRAGFGDLEERHAAALAEWEAKKPEVAAEVGRLSGLADQARSELPRQIVAQYERIAERYDGDALSTVRGTERVNGSLIWHCALCNYQIRSQLAVEIRSRGAIVQCDGCKRFLVAEEEEGT
jgi:predicted  nucleic acid-binding Zn-ribbon protein